MLITNGSSGIENCKPPAHLIWLSLMLSVRTSIAECIRAEFQCWRRSELTRSVALSQLVRCSVRFSDSNDFGYNGYEVRSCVEVTVRVVATSPFSVPRDRTVVESHGFRINFPKPSYRGRNSGIFYSRRNSQRLLSGRSVIGQMASSLVSDAQLLN